MPGNEEQILPTFLVCTVRGRIWRDEFGNWGNDLHLRRFKSIWSLMTWTLDNAVVLKLQLERVQTAKNSWSTWLFWNFLKFCELEFKCVVGNMWNYQKKKKLIMVVYVNYRLPGNHFHSWSSVALFWWVTNAYENISEIISCIHFWLELLHLSSTWEFYYDKYEK